MIRSIVGRVCLLSLLLTSSLHAQLFDSFDSYMPGRLTIQSPWDEFDDKRHVDALVTDQQRFSEPHSLFIVGTTSLGDDVVYDFKKLPGGVITSGRWVFSIKTYVESSAQGTGSVLLMSKYPNLFNTAVSVRFNADTNRLESGGNGGETLPLIRDEWVNVIVSVDIDADRYDAFYGDDIFIENASWRSSHGRTGPPRFVAVRLWARNPTSNPPGTTGMYLDNPRLERNTGPSLALNASPNPVTSGQTLKLKVTGPAIPNAPFGLFVWSLSGAPLVVPVFTGTLDGAGEFSLEASVPAGLGDLDLGFKAFASTPTLTQSNEDLVLFR